MRARCFFRLSIPKARAKAEKWMEKLEEEGPNLPRPFADVIRGKIRELRVSFGSHYRFFYFFVGKKIVMTHGIIKTTRAIPEKEIKKAERIMNKFIQKNT